MTSRGPATVHWFAQCLVPPIPDSPQTITRSGVRPPRLVLLTAVSDAQHAAELVIQRAQARLEGQSRDNDALDVKALGVIAVDAAIFALLAVVHHDALNAYWAIPAGAIILGGLLLVASVFRQAVDAGPNWRTFFEQFGGLGPEPLALQMLSDLLTAIEWNEEHGHWKDLLYEAGFRISVIGLIGAGFAPFSR
jgi:hypothetical protein